MRDPDHHSDHIRPQRVCVRGAPGRRQRLSPEGRTAENLIEAVRVVAAGAAMLAPSVARRIIERFAQLPQPRPALAAALAELTPREQEVLHLVARGRSNSEIATDLFVSEHTAKTHISHVLAKLRLRDRIHAVIFAYESGMVRPGDNE
jgi:DNA-binding NarL/FixJ family response regulator